MFNNLNLIDLVNIINSAKSGGLSSDAESGIIENCRGIANKITSSFEDTIENISLFPKIAHLIKDDAIKVIQTLDEGDFVGLSHRFASV